MCGAPGGQPRPVGKPTDLFALLPLAFKDKAVYAALDSVFVVREDVEAEVEKAFSVAFAHRRREDVS